MNPREISNFIGNVPRGEIPFNKFGFTVALTIWGQFIDHDLDLVKDGRGESVPITISPNDPFIQNQKEIPF